MRWSDGIEKLVGTSDPKKIIEALLLCAQERNLSGPKYRLLSQDDDVPIISNVPGRIYEKENLKKYITPLKTNRGLKFISFLKSNIDILQNSELSNPTVMGKEETFQLNQCYRNSKRLFQLIKHLKKTGVIPKKYKPQIVIGHIVSEIPFGTNIGNIVVEKKGIILHDWHIWNYIDRVLVDLSLFQNGNVSTFDNSISSWGEAKDHVFITPPKGIAYFGKEYSDLSRFDTTIQGYFDKLE